MESDALSVSGLEDSPRDAFLHLEHVAPTTGRQLDHFDTMPQHYQIALQNRASTRLRTLTIGWAIFLPLALIAGIYRMSFRKMPSWDCSMVMPALGS